MTLNSRYVCLDKVIMADRQINSSVIVSESLSNCLYLTELVTFYLLIKIFDDLFQFSLNYKRTKMEKQSANPEAK